MLPYEHDLGHIIPDHLRRLFRRFLFHGVLPREHADLLALLYGDRAVLHRLTGTPDLPGLMIIDAFLERHANLFDIAHGEPAYVYRWQALGGLAGYRK